MSDKNFTFNALGWESIGDDSQPGLSKTTGNEKNVQKVSEILRCHLYL